MRPQAISVGDANAVHFLLALTSGGSQQLAASEQESGDRVRVEGSYRRRHSKGWRTEEPGDPSSPRHASSSRRLRPGRSSHRGGAGVQPSGPHRSSRRRRLSRSRLPRPGSTCSQSTARVYLGPALVESSSNPHRHGAVQEHARRSRSRAGNEDRWPVAGSEIHAACRGPAAQPAMTALPRSHRGTARWGWRCTSEPGRRTNVDVEADAEDTITKTPREEATSSRCRRREDAEA